MASSSSRFGDHPATTQYVNNTRKATEPVLTRAHSRISADEHIGIANFYSTDTPTRLVAVAQLGDHADEYETANPVVLCSQADRDVKSPSAAPEVEHAAPRVNVEECLLGDVERAGLRAQQKRLGQRRALSVPTGVIDRNGGAVTEIGAKPTFVENLLHQLRSRRTQPGSSGDVTVVQDVDGVEVAEWHERIEHAEAEESSTGKIRKYSERLSSGASSLKAGMRKAVRMVSKAIRHDSALETHEKIEDDQPLLPRTSSSPPRYSSLSAPVPDEVHTRRRISKSDEASAYREISSPQSLGYGYSSRPNEYNVCGPNANLAQVAIHVSDFNARFTERSDRGYFENVRRQASFDAMLGNCTTEAEQWEADEGHQRQARLERTKREDEKMLVQAEAQAGVIPTDGTTVATQKPTRSLGLRRMRKRNDMVDNLSCGSKIMSEVSKRSRFGELS